LTIWLHDWLGRGCTTPIWTHLHLIIRWNCNVPKIHWWKPQKRFHLTFQIYNYYFDHVCQEEGWILLNVCWNYHWLNWLTIKNQYLRPLISRLLDQLKQAKVYTKIDLCGAYNLVHIWKGDKWKIAFHTLWPFWVCGDAFWPYECTCHLSTSFNFPFFATMVKIKLWFQLYIGRLDHVLW
jgi:hypothetical protein